jgi:hypothetical protein
MPILCAALVLALGSTAAHAQARSGARKPRVVVFPLESSLPPERDWLAGGLSERVARESRQRGMVVIPAQATFNDTALIAGCETPEDDGCYERLLDQLGADVGVTGTVAPAEEPEQVQVALVYFRRGVAPVTIEVTAEDELSGEAVAEALQPLLDEPISEPEPVAEPEPEPEASPGGALSFSLGQVEPRSWLVLGSGGGMVGAGMAFWLLASQKEAEIAKAPVNTVAELERLASLETKARRQALIGNVLFGAGLAATAVGAVLVVRNGLVREAPAAPAVTVSPMLLTDGMGVAITVGWPR